MTTSQHPDPDPVTAPSPFTDQEWRRVLERLDISGRRVEVLRLLLCGLSDRAIGEALGVKPPTVRTYVTALFEVAGVGDRVCLVLEVVRIALNR